eukprot:1390039-Rhodomonas_salina.1
MSGTDVGSAATRTRPPSAQTLSQTSGSTNKDYSFPSRYDEEYGGHSLFLAAFNGSANVEVAKSLRTNRSVLLRLMHSTLPSN